MPLGWSGPEGNELERDALNGLIYGITHPAFPGYTKIGRTIQSMNSRLKDYQICCPNHKFEVAFMFKTTDVKQSEKLIKQLLVLHKKDAHGEWYKLLPTQLMEVILEHSSKDELCGAGIDLESFFYWANQLRAKYGIHMANKPI